MATKWTRTGRPTELEGVGKLLCVFNEASYNSIRCSNHSQCMHNNDRVDCVVPAQSQWAAALLAATGSLQGPKAFVRTKVRPLPGRDRASPPASNS